MTLPLKHLLLALLVILIWGFNFLFVKLALNEMTPLSLCAIRFLLASIPAIFFIKRPNTSFKLLLLYGLIMFALQFSLLFIGMYMGMSTGMTSIVLQVQVFFSILFAALVLREVPRYWQILGALVAFSGVILVGFHSDTNNSWVGFVFVLSAAASAGIGTLITKRIKNVNMVSLVVWASFIACFPILLLALFLEGPQAIIESCHNMTWLGFISVLYIVYISTWVGYAAWSWLVSKHPVNVIAPFTLLVPIVAILCSVLILHEPLQPWQWHAGFLVMIGLGINLLGGKLFVRKLPVQEIETI